MKVFLIILFLSFYAQASEVVGTFSIEDISLRANLTHTNDEKTQFDLILKSRKTIYKN